MRELSISRKSASIRSLSSGAKICKKDTQPVLLPTPKLLPVLNSKALGFQGFLIIVCVAIYAVLIQNIVVESSVSAAIWTCMGYTVLLCFTLFKTSSLARSLFHAH